MLYNTLVPIFAYCCADLPTALARVSFTWLVSQPVAAAQLVLVTAAEGQSLVGASNFASKLPLAATGKMSCSLQHWVHTEVHAAQAGMCISEASVRSSLAGNS